MSKTTLARNYCANWQDSGKCTGVDVNLKGEHTRFLREGSRCLLSCGNRCGYLEQSVLPMAEPTYEWKNVGQQKAFMAAVDLYKRLHSGLPGLAKRMRLCKTCGTQIGPRMRYCAKCAPTKTIA